MIESIDSAREKMDKAVEHYAHELSSIRTNRANVGLLDTVTVEVYGQNVPIANAATVTVQDAKTLLVTVWDVNNTKAVDSALRKNDFGFNPRIDGNKLFISLPELTEERRFELAKVVKKRAEEAKIAVRNIRRDANDHFKKNEKNHDIDEDQLKEQLNECQVLTDDHIKKIDSLSEKKQQDIMIV